MPITQKYYCKEEFSSLLNPVSVKIGQLICQLCNLLWIYLCIYDKNSSASIRFLASVFSLDGNFVYEDRKTFVNWESLRFEKFWAGLVIEFGILL